MKILFITNLFPVENAIYNGEYIRQQAIFISKSCDLDITYPKALFPKLYTWLENKKQKTFFDPQKPMGLEKTSIRFFYFRYPYYTKFGLKDFLKLMGLFVYVFAKQSKPDLIHAHFTYECGYLGVKLGKFLKIPVVVTVHESFVFQMGKKEKDNDGKWNWDEPVRVIEKKYMFALENCTRIIAVSAKVKEALLKLGIDTSKISVVGNGVDSEKFRITSRSESRKHTGLNDSRKIILYVGSIFPQKGVFDLLDATFNLSLQRKDFVVAFIGGGKKDFLEKMRYRVEEKKLEDFVQFIGPKLPDELPYYFSAAHLCVLPSYRETFSCTAIESLACGTPLVGTPVGVIGDIVKNGQNGYVIPIGKPGILASKINIALDKNWNKESIRDSVSCFYWPNVAESILKIYRGCKSRPLVTPLKN